MAFVSIPGIQGKVFLPDKEDGHSKHPCRGCFACQQCSTDRCRICRREGDGGVCLENGRSGLLGGLHEGTGRPNGEP